MSFSPKAVASVRISLSIMQPDVPYGGNLTAYVVVSNSAWHAYDLNVPSQVTSNIRTSALSGCGWNHPFGIALYSGFINPNNITNATMPLQLWQPGLYSCPSETALSTYYLPARSTNYTKISIDGFWNGSKAGNSSENWTFESLPVGNYTLIAQDYWRQARCRTPLKARHHGARAMASLERSGRRERPSGNVLLLSWHHRCTTLKCASASCLQ